MAVIVRLTHKYTFKKNNKQHSDPHMSRPATASFAGRASMTDRLVLDTKQKQHPTKNKKKHDTPQIRKHS
jgi:hypothetical protein